MSHFLLFCFLPATLASLCHNSHAVTEAMHNAYMESLQAQNRSETVNYLYSLCKNDRRCSRAYYMDLTDDTQESNRVAAFEYLVRHWTAEGGSSMSELTQKFCAMGDPETLRDTLWLAKLRLEAHESLSVRCGANERFVFVPSSLQGECVCADEHNCQENGHLASEPLTLSTVSLVAVSVVIILFVCLRIRNDMALYRVAMAVEKHCDERCVYKKKFGQKLRP